MGIQRINDHVYRIPIPVPFPMKYVYCYLIQGKDGWDLVDTGLNYAAAREVWQDAFAQLQLEPQHIRAIYLTHFHPDHFGLAGWMQQWTGAPVYLSTEDLQMVNRVWGAESMQAKRIRELYLQNGVPEELAQQIMEHMEHLNKQVHPLPEIKPFEQQEVVLGDETWQVIHTPGHSDGHLCFYHAGDRLLIAADHILAKITPNISLWPGCRSNPLQDYLLSLQKMMGLDVERVLPGHGDIVTNLPQRIQEIVAHHGERLENMYELAKDGRTAYQIADATFSHKELTPHQWRFAMAETLAHLEYLVAAGRLSKTDDEGIVYHASVYSDK